jgi:hypothetical protein
MMTNDLKEFIDAMQIVTYTLVDGSRVVGEERAYDYTTGVVTVYGVLEFHQFNEFVALSPYVPESIDTEFVFTDRNIIGRGNATPELKQVYYSSLVRAKLKQVLSPEEYDKYISGSSTQTKPKSKPKSNLSDWSGLLPDEDSGIGGFGGRN